MIHRLHNTEDAVVIDHNGSSVVIPISEILDFARKNKTHRKKKRSIEGNTSHNLTLYARAIKRGKWATGVTFDRDKALERFMKLIAASNKDNLVLSEAAINAALDVAQSFEPSKPQMATLISEIRKAVSLRKENHE